MRVPIWEAPRLGCMLPDNSNRCAGNARPNWPSWGKCTVPWKWIEPTIGFFTSCSARTASKSTGASGSKAQRISRSLTILSPKWGIWVSQEKSKVTHTPGMLSSSSSTIPRPSLKRKLPLKKPTVIKRRILKWKKSTFLSKWPNCPNS